MVTAASEGLGFACAARLADAGCSVAICGRRQDALDKARETLARKGSAILAQPADMADPAALERLVATVLQQFGRLDILVVNSGHIEYGGFEDLSDDQWQQAFDLLLMSCVRLARLCLPAMRANRGGDIVILGSSTAREPPPHLVLSTVMRLGVAGLAKTLARALAPDSIRVNLVAPGYFDTGRVHKRLDGMVAEKAAFNAPMPIAQICGDVPMGRIGAAEELAELVAFVVSRKAGFMTGATITIDGGGSRASVLEPVASAGPGARAMSVTTRLRLYAADLHYPPDLQVHTAASGRIASLSARYLDIERSDGFRGTGEVRANITYLSHLPEEAVDPAILDLVPSPALGCRTRGDPGGLPTM